MDQFNSYFFDLNSKDFINRDIYLRKRRTVIDGFKSVFKFQASDIIKVIYSKKNIVFTFEGLCLSIRKRNFKDPETSFVLRNIFMGVGMEATVSLYYHRLYGFFIQDYKRKYKNYFKAKLYYVRNRVNRESRIKI